MAQFNPFRYKFGTPMKGVTDELLMALADNFRRACSAFTPAPTTAGLKGQVLTADPTLPQGTIWKPKYAAGRMYLNTGQNINNNSESFITSGWTQEVETDPTIIDVDAPNSRITVKRTGYYRISVQGAWTVTTSPLAGYMAVCPNGVAAYVIVAPFQNNNAFYNPASAASDVVLLGANDYLNVKAYWNWGGVATTYLLTAGGRYSTYLSVEFMGDQ